VQGLGVSASAIAPVSAADPIHLLLLRDLDRAQFQGWPGITSTSGMNSSFPGPNSSFDSLQAASDESATAARDLVVWLLSEPTLSALDPFLDGVFHPPQC